VESTAKRRKTLAKGRRYDGARITVAKGKEDARKGKFWGHKANKKGYQAGLGTPDKKMWEGNMKNMATKQVGETTPLSYKSEKKNRER